ncbi:stalk domain-containing protein [Paenibacillus abyssi]|uniref:Copper amine oxidase-like N-terminal domain-containing protein n=1 Tax=Paenibacillus abyssi TaxID=1340531 RepID=A0A917CGL6_9BACL|nr:stalk domain-containing protein [Paenibacillus abyssi]GGF87895.1 hypothetical protein GCM10010916_01530 [Paenibacillus abyssi]
MRKKLVIAALLTSILGASIGFGAFAATKFTLIVNGQVANVEPIVQKGVTYVPVRAAAEMLGANVRYDAATRTVSITSKDGGATETTATAAKSYDVNVTVKSGPMTLKVTKVTLNPAFKYDTYYSPVNAVVFDVEVENTSSDNVGWFPSGEIVTNTKEQVAGYTYESLGGEYKGKVIKKGKIIFEVKSDINQITSLNYFVDAAFDGASYSSIGEDVVTEIILK